MWRVHRKMGTNHKIHTLLSWQVEALEKENANQIIYFTYCLKTAQGITTPCRWLSYHLSFSINISIITHIVFIMHIISSYLLSVTSNTHHRHHLHSYFNDLIHPIIAYLTTTIIIIRNYKWKLWIQIHI